MAAHYTLAQATEMFDEKKAIACYVKVNEMQPDNFKILTRIGQIYLKHKHYNKAQEFLKKSLMINKSSE